MTVASQIVGAFGEKVAEAELLRRGWRTANYNTSIKNAARYDLIAWKEDRMVQLRVKACGQKQNAFQFGCPSGKELELSNLPDNDFTILVRMGDSGVRKDDRFYVIPTRILWDQINIRRREPGKSEKSRLDFGLCTLRLRPHGSGGEKVNYGFEEKWKQYQEIGISSSRPCPLRRLRSHCDLRMPCDAMDTIDRDKTPTKPAAQPRDKAKVLRAKPVTGEIDHAALTREIIRRFPKILDALAK